MESYEYAVAASVSLAETFAKAASELDHSEMVHTEAVTQHNSSHIGDMVWDKAVSPASDSVRIEALGCIDQDG